MPFLLLSFFGFYLGLKTRFYKEITFCLILFLLHFFFYSFFLWHSPCSFGLRYMVSAIPFLVIPLIFVFKKIKMFYIVALGGVSILFNFMGPLFYYTCTKGHLFNYYFPMLFEKGLTNYTFNLVSTKLFYISPWITNIISLIFLGFVIFYGIYIWRDS